MAHPLFKHIPAAEVTAEFKDLASSWPLWESANQPPEEEKDKFHFDYNGDHDSERVLVASGSATLKPDDGSPSVELKPGDAIYLHKGFACSWAVLEPMTTHYGYFDKEGNEIQEVELTCDVCGADCFDESYLFNDEEDICPRCFRADANGAEEFEGAVYQRQGQPAKPPPVKAKSPGKKKAAEVDYVEEGGGSGKKKAKKQKSAPAAEAATADGTTKSEEKGEEKSEEVATAEVPAEEATKVEAA